MRYRIWWALVLLLSCAANSTSGFRAERKLTAADYPGSLGSPADHPGDFIRRQAIVAHFPGHEQSFEAVLQKKGDKLTLIGLAPFGIKAFVLEQSASGVTFKPYLHRDMPFPPEFMLNDIRRTYFDGLSSGALSDGWHEVVQDGERVRELWAGGRLLERHFARLSGGPAGEISIVYVDGMSGPQSPALIELDNGWFGYHLTIRTVSEQAL
jgi:hypothetical protein